MVWERRVSKKMQMAAAAGGLGKMAWTLLILRILRSFVGERKPRFLSGGMRGMVLINDGCSL